MTNALVMNAKKRALSKLWIAFANDRTIAKTLIKHT